MSGDVLEPVIDYFNLPDWLSGTAIGLVIDWIVNGIIFLINSVITILDSVGKFFISIFNGTLFTYLNDTFTYLSAFMGTSGTILFMGLFGLVFIFIIFSFLIRLLRGRLSYSSSLSRINYYKKHPEK